MSTTIRMTISPANPASPVTPATTATTVSRGATLSPSTGCGRPWTPSRGAPAASRGAPAVRQNAPAVSRDGPRSAAGCHQPRLVGEDRGLGAVAQPQLHQNPAHVRL